MKVNPENIHPTDLRLFKTVADAMQFVAKHYQLPLKSVSGFPMPEYKTSPLGDCSRDGNVRLVLRGMQDGKWDYLPLPEDEVYKTAAHELAHLKHFDHGLEFQEFELELIEAMNNRKTDYQQKVLDRLIKLQSQRDGEAAAGNQQAAESFAAMVNKMLIEHELNPTDIDYARAADKDPIVEIFCDLSKYPLPARYRYDIHGKKSRIAWQETLARVVSHAHLCTFLVEMGTNNIVFVGTKSHATTCEYVYGNLVRAALQMSIDERALYQSRLRREGKSPSEEKGFRAAWTHAFITRIAERFRQARQEAVREVSSDINVQNTSLMRLNQTLVKVNNYIAAKFGAGTAKALLSDRGRHAEGSRMGRAAADRINMGRKGIEGGTRTVKGYIE